MTDAPSVLNNYSKTMKNKLLLIDGHNLLFQMFFGMPSKITGRNGKAIQGVIGFIGALRKLHSMVSPTHVAVLFDSQTHNPRMEILDSYKANRPNFDDMADDENPFSQLRFIYSALDTLGIKHKEIENAECDDVMASYALSPFCDTEIYISSFDSDFFQLISDRVKIIRYRGESTVICDESYIKEKLGISPNLYADFKSLTGDSADNIPGVRGIGKVSAAKLLLKYGSLQGILDSSDNDRLVIAAKRETDILLRNRALIKLDAHAPLPFTFDQLAYKENIPPTMETIRKIGL